MRDLCASGLEAWAACLQVAWQRRKGRLTAVAFANFTKLKWLCSVIVLWCVQGVAAGLGSTHATCQGLELQPDQRLS
jgi:hypothetical protein